MTTELLSGIKLNGKNTDKDRYEDDHEYKDRDRDNMQTRRQLQQTKTEKETTKDGQRVTEKRDLKIPDLPVPVLVSTSRSAVYPGETATVGYRVA